MPRLHFRELSRATEHSNPPHDASHFPDRCVLTNEALHHDGVSGKKHLCALLFQKYPERLLSGMKTLRCPLTAYMVAGVIKSKNAAASPTEPANSISAPLVAFKSWKALSLQNEARDAAVKKPSSELELCRSRQREGVSSGGNNPISGSNCAGNGSRESVAGYIGEIKDNIEDETEDTEAAGLIGDDQPAPMRAVGEEAASESESAREHVPRCCATLAASGDNGAVRSGCFSGMRDFEGLSKEGRDCTNAGDGVRAGEGHGDVSNAEADDGELERLTEQSSSSHSWMPWIWELHRKPSNSQHFLLLCQVFHPPVLLRLIAVAVETAIVVAATSAFVAVRRQKAVAVQVWQGILSQPWDAASIEHSIRNGTEVLLVGAFRLGPSLQDHLAAA
ncbi:hypothetical protein B0H17DRAFT_1149697 [Mycena rosella]|uniref:Transmembrane protein n=1 Tax=Mycena rosella TaxID=1033263 RepID=A0AAD7FRU5_MYCRO|nr:hypothetical protein B0H17DRAFT_1149697 [Mycena rosella]